MLKKYIAKLLFIPFVLLSGCHSSESNDVKNQQGEVHQVSDVSAVEEKEIIDEMKELKNSYFGDFSNCKVIRKDGEVLLQVWEPAYDYKLRSYPQDIWDVLEKDVQKELNILYDEIWVSKNIDNLTQDEIRKWKNELDIQTLYWKDGKIQAYTLKEYYVGNPLTDKKLSSPEHKVTHIYDRNYILTKLNEK